MQMNYRENSSMTLVKVGWTSYNNLSVIRVIVIWIMGDKVNRYLGQLNIGHRICAIGALSKQKAYSVPLRRHQICNLWTFLRKDHVI